MSLTVQKHDVSRRGLLKSQINGFYESIDVPISSSKDLSRRVSIVRKAWASRHLDRICKMKLPALSERLITVVESPADLKTIFPLLIASKAAIFGNIIYLPEIIKQLLTKYQLRCSDTLENRTKLFDFLRKVIECDLIPPSHRPVLGLIFEYVMAQEPLDTSFGSFIVSQYSSIVTESYVGELNLLGKIYIENAPLTEADFIRAEFLMRHGANLGERVVKESCWSYDWEIPLVVLAAKEGMISFLSLMVPYLQRKHAYLTGVLGQSAYYHLMHSHERVPAALLHALRPSTQGIPDEVVSYLDGRIRRKPFYNEELSNNIRQFVSTLRDNTEERDMQTFLQAVLVLLTQFPFVYSEEDCEGIIELFRFASNQITDIQPYVLPICIKMLESNARRPELDINLVVGIVGELSPTVCKKSALYLIKKAFERDSKDRRLVDKLFEKLGDFMLDVIGLNVSPEIIIYLHSKGATLTNALITEIFNGRRNELLQLILDNPDRYVETFEAKLIIKAQQRKLYELANAFINAFGDKIFRRLYPVFTYLKDTHLGVDDRHFDQLITREIEYVRNLNPSPSHSGKVYIFDKWFLRRISQEFIDFWGGQSRPEADFNERLEAFPYKGSMNFLLNQRLVWDLFQQDERMKNFPISEIWRFPIDFDVEKQCGPCGLEQEPGFLNSFLQGMVYALETTSAPKTAEWYFQLHANVVEKCRTPRIHGLLYSAHIRSWESTHKDFSTYQVELRNDDIDWGIASLDKDPIGMQDIRSNRFWTLAGQKIQCDPQCNPTVALKNMQSELRALMAYFQALFDAADSRAKRLMISLAWARELEIHHFFSDANGRSSHLAFVSLIAGQKDLPFFLFPDPNVFDCNGPESLFCRYLEACVNFRSGGVEVRYTALNSVKALEYVNLTGHDDLRTLLEEVKPLVVGKRWSEVVPLPTKESLLTWV